MSHGIKDAGHGLQESIWCVAGRDRILSKPRPLRWPKRNDHQTDPALSSRLIWMIQSVRIDVVLKLGCTAAFSGLYAPLPPLLPGVGFKITSPAETVFPRSRMLCRHRQLTTYSSDCRTLAANGSASSTQPSVCITPVRG